jgi:Holliday junction resolvase-like predicted endonuclease
MVIVEIIIINFVEVRKKENLNIKSMANSVNAAKNILKEGLKIFGQGLSNIKGERKLDVINNAHSMTSEAQPIGSAVGG